MTRVAVLVFCTMMAFFLCCMILGLVVRASKARRGETFIQLDKIPQDEGQLYMNYFVADVKNYEIKYIAEKGGWQTRHDATKQMLETLYAEFRDMCPADAELLFVTNDNSSFMAALPDGMKALTYTTKPSRPDCVAIPDFTFYHFPEAGWPKFYDFYDEVAAATGEALAFEDRLDVMFWIGTFCHPERVAVINAHRDLEGFELIELSWAHGSPPPPQYVSIQDHGRYKYLLDVRGNGAWSVRLKYLLLLGSVVFVVERDESEYWWNTFRPWEHYVPVAADASDLVANYELVKQDPAMAKRIALNGRQRALEEFKFDQVYSRFAQIIGAVA